MTAPPPTALVDRIGVARYLPAGADRPVILLQLGDSEIYEVDLATALFAARLIFESARAGIEEHNVDVYSEDGPPSLDWVFNRSWPSGAHTRVTTPIVERIRAGARRHGESIARGDAPDWVIPSNPQ